MAVEPKNRGFFFATSVSLNTVALFRSTIITHHVRTWN